ncbi:MAG TPA: class I SAM-dependent methyltransferase, partial [Jatrophihabitantaceae bacterium]|nr:class I SAM-dependent methyltransferase [Jatrophihabitantaceae bacterium]
LSKVGFGTHEWVPSDNEYGLKESEGTSHTVLVDMLTGVPPRRILDLGCSGGLLAERLRGLGHHVTGVDGIEIDGVRDRVDEFVLGDLEDGIPADVGTGFDVVVAADVIEHVRDPRALLSQMNDRVARGGQVLVSTPNFGHWYPRARVASGRFDYDRRGILDQTHLRFFSRRSLLRTIQSAGLEVQELRYTGLPFDVLSRDASLRTRAVRRVDELLVKLRPTLFAYQFVLRTTPRAGGSVTRG